MADQEAAVKRIAAQTKLFDAVIFGRRELKSASDANRFLEALCAQEDASKCVERLVAAPKGLDAVAKAYRFSSASDFLNGAATSVIHHLSHPSVKQLYGGQFLRRVLEQIVQPPTFWHTFIEAHNGRVLTLDGTYAFAWLLLELLHSRSEGVPQDVRDIAARVNNDKSLINSESLGARKLGHRIRHVLESTSNNTTGGPGGRHDNDFADFRKVQILPTADEFASSETPFYRCANDLLAVEAETRGLAHLDNQFRLLREDLLGELRSDYQIATGAKKGRRRIVLDNLQLAGFDCGTVSRRKPCALKLYCKDDITQLRHVKGVVARKKHIIDNKNFLKHQSLGCLISNGNIVAFATVERDEDLLAQKPAIVVLRMVDASSFNKALKALKMTQDLHFVQVDTAVFAYEPVLKCLQSMVQLPLEEQVLNFTPESGDVLSGIEPAEIINTIRKNWEKDLRATFGASKSIHLDLAQAGCLLSGLGRRLSLIQGPPGK
jgi:hypothetical protein